MNVLRRSDVRMVVAIGLIVALVVMSCLGYPWLFWLAVLLVPFLPVAVLT